jgi:hypothetical protein
MFTYSNMTSSTVQERIHFEMYSAPIETWTFPFQNEALPTSVKLAKPVKGGSQSSKVAFNSVILRHSYTMFGMCSRWMWDKYDFSWIPGTSAPTELCDYEGSIARQCCADQGGGMLLYSVPCGRLPHSTKYSRGWPCVQLTVKANVIA